MSSISASMPIGVSIVGAKPLPPPPVAQKDEIAKNYPEHLPPLSDKEPSPAERYAQIEKQDAVKAHTVFRANGKIVAFMSRDGVITTFSNAEGAGIARIIDETVARDLRGEQAKNFTAIELEKSLRKIYGGGLSVQRFESSVDAPTTGELYIEMTGIDWRRDPMSNPLLHKPVSILA